MSPLFARLAIIGVTTLVGTVIPFFIQERPVAKFVFDRLGPRIVDRAETKIIDRLGPPTPTPTPAPVPEPAPTPDPNIEPAPPEPVQPTWTDTALRVVKDVVNVIKSILLRV